MGSASKGRRGFIDTRLPRCLRKSMMAAICYFLSGMESALLPFVSGIGTSPDVPVSEVAAGSGNV